MRHGAYAGNNGVTFLFLGSDHFRAPFLGMVPFLGGEVTEEWSLECLQSADYSLFHPFCRLDTDAMNRLDHNLSPDCLQDHFAR